MRAVMSVRRILIGSVLITCSLAVAADEEQPEIEFIEYLGLWEDAEEDWTMFSDPIEARNDNDEQSDPVPEGKESTETKDES
jgi:hypothetical protein